MTYSVLRWKCEECRREYLDERSAQVCEATNRAERALYPVAQQISDAFKQFFGRPDEHIPPDHTQGEG